MAWKTIERAAKHNPDDKRLPIRFYLAGGGRVSITIAWLESIGKKNADRVTFMYDVKRKLIGFEFIEADLINSYKVSTQRDSKTTVNVASKNVIKMAEAFGYPDKRDLTVLQDETNANVWVIQKEG